MYKKKQTFGVRNNFVHFYFEINLHLYDLKYSNNSNTVKYYYQLKDISIDIAICLSVIINAEIFFLWKLFFRII